MHKSLPQLSIKVSTQQKLLASWKLVCYLPLIFHGVAWYLTVLQCTGRLHCYHSKLSYLQLAIRSEQTCRSRGYSFRFIGQANVSEIRILYRTDPYGKMRMYTFGMMMLWKWPSFSFEKNRSGIQTRFASVNVRYLRRPVRGGWEKK